MGTKRSIAAIFACFVLTDCATVDVSKTSSVEPQYPVYYTLRSEKTESHSYPLPLEATVLVDWKYSDETIRSGKGFSAWDVDHDGHFDMLEVLDPEGKTSMWAFDFDSDGQIDATQVVKYDKSAASMEHPSLLQPSH